jgi:hypothetical protein
MKPSDVIIGRAGDSLLGTVLNKEFRVTTAFGKLTLAKKRVAWIHFTNPPQFDVDEIWLHSGDRLLGKVSGSAIRFRPMADKEIEIPYSAIHTLMLRGIDPKAGALLRG